MCTTKSAIALAWLLLAFNASAADSSNTTKPIDCAKGLQMFVSRGTGEPMGSGATKAVGATAPIVEAIAKQIPGSSITGVPYPASKKDPSYFISVGEGTKMVKEMATEYAKECPDSKMAFFGWSQGAQITSNIFCGMPIVWSLGDDVSEPKDIAPLFALAEPLSTDITKNVVSIVLFGDTTHSANATYNQGNSTGSGIFHRDDSVSVCEDLGQRIRSYCDRGDPFCDVGKYVDPVQHVSYANVYGEDVVKYVVEQFKNGGQTGNKSDDGSSDNSTPPPSEAGGLGPAMGTVFLALALAVIGLS